MTAGAIVCRGCGSEIAPSLLSCPACHWLVHADTLKQLAQDAERAAAGHDTTGAPRAWREALDLLPAGSRQHQTISEKVQTLTRAVVADPDSAAGAGAPESHRHAFLKRAGSLGVLALLLWKFKFVVAFILTKGKLLLLGLTKGTTFLSMLVSLGVYWAAWGWKFALGVVVSIYIHEMGHVAQLQRFGIKASAPMFIPGFGAFVRLKQHPATPAEDASVGLAGPLWGLGASLAAYGVFLVTAIGIWAAIAQWSARINSSPSPVWQLDGSRGFQASRAPSAGWWLRPSRGLAGHTRGNAGPSLHRRGACRRGRKIPGARRQRRARKVPLPAGRLVRRQRDPGAVCPSRARPAP